jgi:aminopeptidase N
VLASETLALSLGSEMSVSESTRHVEFVATSHPALAWNFARANMDALLKQVTLFGRNVYVPDIMKAFTDAPRADELEAYVREKFPPDAFAEAAKISDRIRHLAIVKKRELPIIDAWVKERVKNPEL